MKSTLTWLVTDMVLRSRQAYTKVFLDASLDWPRSEGEVKWNTEIVNSSQSVLVPYGGSALTSDTSYTFQVRGFDETGSGSAFSFPFSFDTGLFEESDWLGAQWIGGFNQLRYEFNLSAAVYRARVFVSGVGYYELYINGNRVGDRILDVPWTNYNKRVKYSVYDVTSSLITGNNAIGAMLGGGWYSQGLNAAPALRLLLKVSYHESSTSVPSSKDWSGCNGPIISNSIYNGETYDARLETPGWTSPNFINSDWTSVVTLAGPDGHMSAQLMPPIKVGNVMKPKSVNQPAKGHYIFDFEQNFSGFCQLFVKAPRGVNITLRHAEIIDKQGMLNTKNLRSAKASDTYITKGDPNGETYRPRFTYHGFRFVEWTSTPSVTYPSLSSLVCYHVYSSVSTTGSISTNNAVLNQVQQNIWWGQTSNLMSVPTDCDQRDERLGWTADAHLSSEEALLNFDTHAFYANWLDLIRDDQTPFGGVADTVPFIRYGRNPGDPSWGSVYPILLDGLLTYRGDYSTLSNHYEGAKLWVEFLVNNASGSSLKNLYYFYADWVPPPPAASCSGHLVSSFSLILNVQQMVRFASVLNRSSDKVQYLSLLRSLASAFNLAFFNSSTALYDNGVQACLALPLFLGIVPPASQGQVLTNLVNDISNQGNHLSTGILGTKYLMTVLSQLGRTDIAMNLAVQTTYPSWGYMFHQTLEVEATTLWELWNSPTGSPSMDSRNHIMFGSVSAWYYSWLGGIQSTAPGYQAIKISPPNYNTLITIPCSAVSASIETPYGQVTSSWGRQGGLQCTQISRLRSNLRNFGYGLGKCDKDHVRIGCNGVGSIRSISLEESCGDTGSLQSVAIQSLLASCLDEGECCLPLDELMDSGESASLKSRQREDSFFIRTECSISSSYFLNVSIPVGRSALVDVTTLDLSNPTILEGSRIVWANGKFISGVPGITAASEVDSKVEFEVLSGNYSFSLSGSSRAATIIQSELIPVGQLFHISCGLGGKMSSIIFASFASHDTPIVEKKLIPGRDHVGSSKMIVEKHCLGRGSCSFKVNPREFGVSIDRSRGFALIAQAQCSA